MDYNYPECKQEVRYDTVLMIFSVKRRTKEPLELNRIIRYNELQGLEVCVLPCDLQSQLRQIIALGHKVPRRPA